jgi:hypothetical protein
MGLDGSSALRVFGFGKSIEMSITTTILFDRPQLEIGSLIVQRMSLSTATSIVTGFATPGGFKVLASAIKTRPSSIAAIVVGAATYPAFEVLDDLHAAGTPLNRLHIHLGHTRPSGTHKNPTVRFHPMLHSKIYYMEFPDGDACAFIGSHNMTSFALNGLNGEAAVLLEGPVDSIEFEHVRNHIEETRRQSVQYSPGMKESLAWWTREFIDGMKAEVRLPIDWIVVRTILIFAQAGKHDLPVSGDILYFEIPVGIDQIESLKAETHLFLFDTMPSNSWTALQGARNAHACFTCKTLGADNKQGNLEVEADWQIDGKSTPILKRVPSKILRPSTSSGMQQVRAEVVKPGIDPFEYLFDIQKKEWNPRYLEESHITDSNNAVLRNVNKAEDPDDRDPGKGWRLVTGLVPRENVSDERDMRALELVAPSSGSFVLVSLRRRRNDPRTPPTGNHQIPWFDSL